MCLVLRYSWPCAWFHLYHGEMNRHILSKPGLELEPFFLFCFTSYSDSKSFKLKLELICNTCHSITGTSQQSLVSNWIHSERNDTMNLKKKSPVCDTDKNVQLTHVMQLRINTLSVFKLVEMMLNWPHFSTYHHLGWLKCTLSAGGLLFNSVTPFYTKQPVDLWFCCDEINLFFVPQSWYMTGLSNASCFDRSNQRDDEINNSQ